MPKQEKLELMPEEKTHWRVARFRLRQTLGAADFELRVTAAFSFFTEAVLFFGNVPSSLKKISHPQIKKWRQLILPTPYPRLKFPNPPKLKNGVN